MFLKTNCFKFDYRIDLKQSIMQKNLDFNLTYYAKRYWFQLSIVAIVLYTLTNKDFSFQVNMNNPEIENSINKTNPSPQKEKESKELITSNSSNPKVAKSEASFFSKIPFIGGGTSSKKKSELPQIDESIVASYIRRFAHVAINERKKYGVPSSIIIANALFHSYAGKRDMTLNGNNHFSIPCTTDWSGSNGNYAGNCFRHYENAWASFRDHSLYVTSGKYEKLRQLESTDYKGWAKNMEHQGFSNFDDLEENLIKLIEKYELNQLDFQ